MLNFLVLSINATDDDNMICNLGGQPLMTEQAVEDAMIIAAQSNPSHV